MKKVATGFILIIIAILIASIFTGSHVASFTINGQEVEGPLRILGESFGLLIVAVAMLSVAIMLAFFLTGIGLFILGSIVSFGLIFVGFSLPMLLPVLLPLFVVGIFVALTQKQEDKTKE